MSALMRIDEAEAKAQAMGGTSGASVNSGSSAESIGRITTILAPISHLEARYAHQTDLSRET